MQVSPDRKGILFVVSAPSGAGKTSLCRDAAKSIENLYFSVSHTTRAPRAGETEGEDYFFVDETLFRKGIDKGHFIEWAEVHGCLYGTSREQLTHWTEQGKDVILDIDSQGAMTLKQHSEEGVYIYILPPSFDILKQRLIARGSDSKEEISRRLKKAKEEISHFHQYHYLIVNRSFDKARREFESVIIAERLRIRQSDLPALDGQLIRPLLEKE